MTTEKDPKTGKWLIQYRYKDWTGKNRKSTKRGFKTKREAEEWYRDFLMKQSQSCDMKFKDFTELYAEDMKHRLCEHTMINKMYVIRDKLIPYFGEKRINEITAADIRIWQNQLIQQGYKPTYLKSINNQLSAIFNYAVKYYELKDNPCRKAGSMGKAKADEMEIWTKDEFQQFADCLMDKRISWLAFQILFWTGIRIGDDDDKIRLNQRKPSKYKGLSRFGPEKNLQRINKFMKERPTFYKKLIQMKENFRFYLRCFYCITKVVILQFNSEKQDRISS